MAQRMGQVNGTDYEVGAGESLYLTNGGTTDWIYGTFGIPAFTIELPTQYFVEGGFFTSEEMIEPAFNENLPAMLYFVNFFVTGKEDATLPTEIPPGKPEPLQEK